MEQLKHKPEVEHEALVRLLGQKIRLDLRHTELETLRNMMAMWIFSGIGSADNLSSRAFLQQSLKMVENKLRPGLLKMRSRHKIKLDLMQAHCLMQALDDMMFLPAAGFELNVANRVMTQIDSQL
jgi:hypothetical protein